MRSISTTTTVVVPTYNRHRQLTGAIDSLLDQELAASAFEILIVDNSADQSEAAAFGQRYDGLSRVRYLLEGTVGLSNARNRGVQEARGRIVAFIDDDAIASRQWLKQLVAAFDDAGGIGCAGGRVAPRWPAERPRWIHDDLLGYLTIVDRGSKLRDIGPDEWLAGCNLAFDRDALLAAGGFSRELGRIGQGTALLSNDELDACNRVRASGKRVVYTPDAVVEHFIDPERLTKAWFRRRVAWQAVSDYLMNPVATVEMARLTPRHLESTTGDEADDFRIEMGKIYAQTILLLCGEPE